jgi:uncharacterized protein (TIGR02466 family)
VEPKGPFAFFEQIVNEAVQHYLKVLPKDAEHPYLAFRPQRWQLAVWGVILGAQGHQVPHIHPDAWVSGVYYASLPPIVSRAGESCAGWIEFGQPPAEFRAGGRHAVRAIQPEEGLMLLFPSYFYHRTIPYASEGERVSIAFDVVPRADH